MDQGSGGGDRGLAGPPRLADWLLERVLPLGKRGESIRGDLLEEFRALQARPEPRSLIPDPRLWYWRQSIQITIRYLRQPAQTFLPAPRRSPMLMDLTSDLRTATRMTMRSPGTSSLIVFTLAIAMAAATIGFTFADLALFRGIPVDDNSKVVSFFASDSHGSTFRARVSAPDLLDYRSRTTTLEQLSAMRDARAPLITGGQSQTLNVTYATANVFAAMGQSPLVGRVFVDGEDLAGVPPVAVLSHHYWRDEMGGRIDAIGRTLQIGRELVTVVGVLTPGIEFGNLAEIDLWLPLELDQAGPRDARELRFIGRLRPGVSFDQAAAEIAAIGDALAAEHPATNAGWKIRLIPIRDLTGGDGFWVVIALFLLSIGLLMAIATANVSNLIMARASARARELAVRTAMGARTGRLLRQFFIEGLLLSAVSAGLSIPLALTGLRAIGAFAPEVVFQQLRIDLHEISFVAILALVCPVMFSLASARLIANPDLRQVLAAQGGRGSTATMKGRGLLVIAQVALAVILLTASSLALQSIRGAFGQPLGMAVERSLIFSMDFNDAIYPDHELARAAADAIGDAVRRMPGVARLSTVDALPVLSDSGPTAFAVDQQAAEPGAPTPTAVVTGAGAAAPATLGVSLRVGSWWVDGDGGGAVISQTTAERYFDGVERAVGRNLTLQVGGVRREFRVIGVSTDVANTNRTEAPPSRIWIPMPPSTRRMTFVVDARDPAALAGGVRTAAAAVAPAVPVERLQTFSEAMRRAEASDYVVIGVLAGFAIVALLLATSGLFGVVSFTVAQRTPEFGTRMALGASASDVVRLVARQSLGLVGVGLLVGLMGGVGVGFAMGSMLFGTTPTDPATLGGVSALLAAVALLATAWPAWRASRIDPVVALRAE